MSEQASPATLKQSTLETLGYLCEDISHEDLVQEEVNTVLQAIINGTQQSETNTQVHLAAIKALHHALDIAQVNFDYKDHRDFIMRIVFDKAMSHEAEIRHAAFECLVSIASIYYEVMEQYMGTIGLLTSEAINGDEESVALKALEFWSSICNVEIELQEFENPDPSDWSPPHSGFIRWALPHLVPVLLETLLKQDQGDHVSNLSIAAGTCLGLVARTVGDDIVPFVRSFVEAKISEPHWSSREAATYALGINFGRAKFCQA
ncbi:unnamed protein product [Arabis nemorensis]|uniref:Interferon-related developmental regulator N-terminal domain-containing protein n=1 Tax=Arabis nemorensis TaxID=586526 RepID=A0A565CHG0_9BRAS|nr:unnamed protein product [Arabis nemorensis]